MAAVVSRRSAQQCQFRQRSMCLSVSFPICSTLSFSREANLPWNTNKTVNFFLGYNRFFCEFTENVEHVSFDKSLERGLEKARCKVQKTIDTRHTPLFVFSLVYVVFCTLHHASYAPACVFFLLRLLHLTPCFLTFTD